MMAWSVRQHQCVTDNLGPTETWRQARITVLSGSGGKIFSFFRFYLFMFRDKRRDGEREREKHLCDCLWYASNWGPGTIQAHDLTGN